MKSVIKLSVFVFVLEWTTLGFAIHSAQAVQVLANGGLEDSAGPSGWVLTQSITGMPGAPISVVEHVDQANEPAPAPGELGLLIKPFAGNSGTYADQNKMVNMNLSQTFSFGASAAGRTYTFSGHSFFQGAASNIIDTLFSDSPSGAVPSPTNTYFELAFLNASDSVLDTHTLDLRSDLTPDAWRTQSVMGTAPAGTTKIRVTAAATDMVASCTTDCPAGQDVRFDNFSLMDSTFPTERLANANLNSLGAPGGWTIEKTPEDNISFSGSPSFAANTGSVGMWLRSFSGGDAKILQTVPGMAGGKYTFSAFSKWEMGYNGADPFSNTQTFMTMEFLDDASAVIGTKSLDLRTVQSNDGTWRELSLNGTAPAGTANVRVSAGATAMANSAINPQSAFFDDFSLMLATVGIEGDYNGNGTVDAADYVLWRNDPAAFGGDPGGYNTWRANFGAMAGSGSGNLLASAAAVPEPAAASLALLALLLAGVLRCR